MKISQDQIDYVNINYPVSNRVNHEELLIEQYNIYFCGCKFSTENSIPTQEWITDVRKLIMNNPKISKEDINLLIKTSFATVFYNTFPHFV